MIDQEISFEKSHEPEALAGPGGDPDPVSGSAGRKCRIPFPSLELA
jgi:hypothetical protein